MQAFIFYKFVTTFLHLPITLVSTSHLGVLWLAGDKSLSTVNKSPINRGCAWVRGKLAFRQGISFTVAATRAFKMALTVNACVCAFRVCAHHHETLNAL